MIRTRVAHWKHFGIFGGVRSRTPRAGTYSNIVCKDTVRERLLMDMSDVQDLHVDKQSRIARIVPTSWFLGLLACSLLIVIAMMGWAGLGMDLLSL